MTPPPPPPPVPKTALVTGAARRIGRALALTLAEDGFAVAVHYRGSAEAARETVATIRARGGKAEAFAADLSDGAATESLLPTVSRALGPVGVLINNASLFERDDPLTATHDSWHQHLAVNLTAPFFLMQHFARALPTDAGGVIVNILDQRVWNLTPHFTSYTASKAGLWALTQSCALAFAPRIRVNAIGPGPTLQSARQTAAQFEKQYRRLPLGRPVGVEEICGTLRLILDAPSMTGQMIVLDSGQHLGWQQPLDRDAGE
jgi:NAD(P)-dependent dehydrogenase (short-subunit alcohol dehydrogenase family)